MAFSAAVAASLFAATALAQAYDVLKAFSSDGLRPYAGLIQGTDGSLYGAAANGGANSYGTIFKIDTNGTTFTTLHNFVGGDGAYPYGGLIQGTDGNLYGTTLRGGTSGNGTIFKIDTGGTTLTTLHSFAGSDGAEPRAGLIQGTDGNLYGTTYSGGANNYGTIFKISADASTFITLHSFTSRDGADPYAGLLQGTDGNLYGTTAQGGANGYGTIFKTDIGGSTFTALHDFGGSDGVNPYASLAQATDGNLYGTTSDGGANGYGTIFKIDTNGTTLTTLHSFADSDGANPLAALIQGSDGDLYGTTYQGGANGWGTIFKTDTNGSTFATLHGFGSSDGAYPSASLLQSTDGSVYGTAAFGGPGGGGVVFRLRATFVTAAVAPTSGPASGGTTVTVSGTGFDPTNTVSFSAVAATGVNFVSQTQIDATSPPLSPGTLNNLSVTSPTSVPSTLPKAFLADFLDVPQSDGFHNFVEKTFRDGITAGYGNGHYGRDDSITRAQMAVFLLKGEHGSSYAPPPASGAVFGDVPANAFAAAWIEQLSNEGITAGCGGGNYCPNDPVTRAQMAVFLLRAEHGSSYAPPACAPPGIFGDVTCPGGFAVDWIEQLSREGITAGCGGGNYCPGNPSTRGQMAVFLVTTFGL
ncbi:MAG: choice-of-anchor tandem repeat GloVer-containing protein [Thermoanaerobaculia bacterium]